MSESNVKPNPETPRGFGGLPYHIELRDIFAISFMFTHSNVAGVVDPMHLWLMAYEYADIGLKARVVSLSDEDEDEQEVEDSELGLFACVNPVDLENQEIDFEKL